LGGTKRAVKGSLVFDQVSGYVDAGTDMEMNDEGLNEVFESVGKSDILISSLFTVHIIFHSICTVKRFVMLKMHSWYAKSCIVYSMV
jgi:hypothetical protein